MCDFYGNEPNELNDEFAIVMILGISVLCVQTIRSFIAAEAYCCSLVMILT